MLARAPDVGEQFARARRVAGLALGELGEVHHADERVVDLVRHLPDHLADRRELLDLHHALVLAAHVRQTRLRRALTAVHRAEQAEECAVEDQAAGADDRPQQQTPARDGPLERLGVAVERQHAHDLAAARAAALDGEGHIELDERAVRHAFLGMRGALLRIEHRVHAARQRLAQAALPGDDPPDQRRVVGPDDAVRGVVDLDTRGPREIAQDGEALRQAQLGAGRVRLREVVPAEVLRGEPADGVADDRGLAFEDGLAQEQRLRHARRQHRQRDQGEAQQRERAQRRVE